MARGLFVLILLPRHPLYHLPNGRLAQAVHNAVFPFVSAIMVLLTLHLRSRPALAMPESVARSALKLPSLSVGGQRIRHGHPVGIPCQWRPITADSDSDGLSACGRTRPDTPGGVGDSESNGCSVFTVAERWTAW
jgi:hypothetical protein